MVALFEASLAAVNNVGDSSGWSLGVDYANWASSKTFHVGDVLAFKYNPSMHSVLEVTQNAFNSCDTSSPISAHKTGSDSITLDKPGHHYFICGTPGHCGGGQKVDVLVA
ncbi:hypothetical protein ACFE04_031406 [Oxalis oulophora]